MFIHNLHLFFMLFYLIHTDYQVSQVSLNDAELAGKGLSGLAERRGAFVEVSLALYKESSSSMCCSNFLVENSSLMAPNLQ